MTGIVKHHSMALNRYNKKRNFATTPEPEGKAETKTASRFVVQRHHASHLHYDFRLELGGALKSWAIPKGPSLNPKDKRLAMMVENHPVSYINFSGDIPQGNYGAGNVIIWDKGNFIAVNKDQEKITEKQALAALHKGELKFILKGRKLKGEFVLVHLHNDKKKDNSWLLIKHKDEYAVNNNYNSEDFVSDRVKKTAEKKFTKKKLHKNPQIPPPEKKLSQYYKPMLATPAEKAFDNKEWIFEIKWDGYRAIAEWVDKKLKLCSRNGLSFLEKYPAIAEAVKKISHDAVVDGEIVLLDENLKPSFQKLQHFEDNTHLPLIYYVFDLLFLDQKDIRHLPLIERKKLLKKLLRKNKNSLLQYCDHIEEKGKDFFETAVKNNLEGMIAKKADSEYKCGIRSKDWLKIKHKKSREGIIVGYTQPRRSRKHFGALVLGQYDEGELKYMGHTGTGFDEKTLKELWNRMQPLITDHSPFNQRVKVNMPVTWLKPKLVCELNFSEVTEDGLLRHPVYTGLRIDKNFTEVKRSTEEPAALKENTNDKTIVVNKHEVVLSNLTKLYWPDDNISKGDMIKYYEAVADYILPYLKDRPLSLKRNPNGILDEGFFHKDAGGQAPAWISKINIHSESNDKTIHYIMCNNKASLLYIANLGCIEMNPWNSTSKKIDKPTYMVIDIDPSPKNSFDEVIQTALVVKSVLDKAGADCYCKTSGATGLHVYVPMGGKYSYEQVKDFAHIIAGLTVEQLNDITTIERSLSKRNDRIYVDYLQNRTGQTLASAYSVRPKPGAPVSAPLEWSEVKKGLSPSQFTIQNMLKRIQKKGDLFLPVLQKGIDLRKCLQKLEQ